MTTILGFHLMILQIGAWPSVWKAVLCCQITHLTQRIAKEKWNIENDCISLLCPVNYHAAWYRNLTCRECHPGTLAIIESVVAQGMHCLKKALAYFESCCGLQHAKAQLHTVLENNPTSGHAWHTLGQMAEETGELQEASRCYTQGLHSPGMVCF